MTLSLLSVLRTICSLLIWFVCELIHYYLIWAKLGWVELVNSFWQISDHQATTTAHNCNIIFLRPTRGNVSFTLLRLLQKVIMQVLTRQWKASSLQWSHVLKTQWTLGDHNSFICSAWIISFSSAKISSFNAYDILLMFVKCFEVYHNKTCCVNSGTGKKCQRSGHWTCDVGIMRQSFGLIDQTLVPLMGIY